MRMYLLICALAAAGGCQAGGVRWEQPQAAPGDTLGVLAVGEGGAPRFIAPETAPVPPLDANRCEGTLAVAVEGVRLHAAWMRLRPDSTVAVVASRSEDGRTWAPVQVVDSVDVGKFGCARPGPAIAAAAGYVHVAYSLKAPEGYGVFFAHSMDQMPMFHSPVIVVYGDRLSATSAAAYRDRVAIAYEDPNGSGKRIDVALSATQGHTFEKRERGSPDEMEALRPRIGVGDSTVILSFENSGGARSMRIGRIP